MSLSYLKKNRTLGAACAVAIALCCSYANAAQYYWQPQLDVIAETNTNRDLVTKSGGQSSEGYSASLGAIFGIATPRTQSEIRPQVRFQDYPDQPNAEETEGGIDFSSSFESARSEFDVYGRAERRDVYNAELASPRFDELNPENQISPETGRIGDAGETRDLLNLQPAFQYQLTERFQLGLRGGYEKVNYSSNALTGRVDYDYVNAGVYPTWQATERLETFVGAYATQYSSADDTLNSDSIGASAGLSYEWSKVFSAELSLTVERTEIDDRVPVLFKDEVTSVGGRFVLVRKAAVTDLRLEIGHLITPTGSGGMYETDQLQVQYDRRLSERLTLETAALYYRDRAMSDFDSGGDRDYASAEVALSWNVTRTWSVFGGYRYIWQEYKQEADGAENHSVFLGVGYRGLGRRP